MVKSLALMIILFAATSVQAFALRQTDQGSTIRWHSSTVEIILDSSLQLLGDKEQVEDTIIEAFEQWEDLAALPIQFNFSRGDCSQPGYVSGGQNYNCVLASERITLSDNEDAGATTLVTYKPSSGQIIDGDIVFYAGAGNWIANDEEKSKTSLSLRGVAAHEIGHLLGLAHSDIEKATMFPMIGLGENTKNTLHLDDLTGAEKLYFDGVDDVSSENFSCSTVSPGQASKSPFYLLGILGLFIGLFFRSRPEFKLVAIKRRSRRDR